MPSRSTHGLDLGEVQVVKTFKSWGRSEHVREWEGLKLLSTYAPDLAPTPLWAELGTTPPVVGMSRLPGRPLGPERLTEVQLAALADSMKRLHYSVPPSRLQGLRPRVLGSTEATEHVFRLCQQYTHTRKDRLATTAFKAGQIWISGAVKHELGPAGVTPVFGHGDPNPANYLWDGNMVRILDFEDSGRSDLAFELAVTGEHIAIRLNETFNVEDLLGRFQLDRDQKARLLHFRKVWALFWLVLLLPGNAADRANPRGSLHKQCRRVLSLLVDEEPPPQVAPSKPTQ